MAQTYFKICQSKIFLVETAQACILVWDLISLVCETRGKSIKSIFSQHCLSVHITTLRYFYESFSGKEGTKVSLWGSDKLLYP